MHNVNSSTHDPFSSFKDDKPREAQSTRCFAEFLANGTSQSSLDCFPQTNVGGALLHLFRLNTEYLQEPKNNSLCSNFVISRKCEHMDCQSKPSCMFGTTNAKEGLNNSAWLSKLARLQSF
jgi:hypothetical protein